MKLNFKFNQLRRLLVFLPLTFFTILTFLRSPAQVKPSTAEERLEGLKKRNVLARKSLLDTIKFRNIGPSIMGGRVVDIDANPKDPTEFYLAYATGGLWHTKNNGQSFNPIFDKEDVSGIGDIAVNWNTREIWVGTGEANSSRSSYSGIGVYKSNDNGKTWQYLGLPESHHIGKIILHPSKPDIAWVAVTGHLYSPNKQRGVYKTVDGGKTWKQVLYVDENTGAIDLDINQKNPDELYACMWHRERRAWNFVESGSSSGIYKSSDGGNSWKLITAKGSGFPTGDVVGRSGIAVFQSDPQILFACVDNQGRRPDTASKKIDTNSYDIKIFKNLSIEDFLKLDKKRLDSFFIKNNFDEKYNDSTVKEMVRKGQIKPSAIYEYLTDENNDPFKTPVIGCEVYKSINAGISWEKVNTKGLDIYNSYGYYFGKIAVSPVNQNKIVVSGFNLILSDDGGKTFASTDKVSTHPDWHGCWINPGKDSNWIAGNDGGCNITYDNGKHWFKVNTPAVGQFYSIDADNAQPYKIYGGLQDNGVWYGPSDLSITDEWDYENPYPWKNLGGGDGMQVQVDTRDNKTVFMGSQFGFYERKSIDEKESKNIHPMPDLGEQQLRYNWQTPIFLSRHNEDILYFGTNRFYRTMNKGNNFKVLSGDLTHGKKPGDVPFGTITTISESPLKFGLLYCGTDDGNIHVSKDGGYTWTLVSTPLPQNLYISRVVASQYKEGRVYTTLNGYRNDNFTPWLYVSEDYGKSWTALGRDLPEEPLNVVREDPKKENILYVGSDNGLYATFNRGKSFMTFGNLPRVPVHDIAIQKTANEIVVATHGRSIYIASLKNVHKILDLQINDAVPQDKNMLHKQ
jgi:BNR/Asp-box repeat.